MTINYYLDTTSSAILLVVQHKGKKFRLSTSEIIKPSSHWDTKNQRVKSSFKDYEAINKKLDSKKDFIKKLVRDYETANHTVPALDYIKEKLNLDPNTNSKTFDGLVEALLEDYKKTRQPKTYKSFLNLKARIKNFKEDRGIKLSFHNLNKETIEAFKLYLSEGRKCSQQTVKNYLSSLATLLSYGINNNYLDSKLVNFNWFKVKVTKTQGDKIFLSDDEIERIERLKDLPKKLQRTKDAFLLQCYTGLRYSDIRTLRPVHIMDGMIVKVTKKTKQRICVPLTDKAQEIVERCMNNLTKTGELIYTYYDSIQNNQIRELGQMINLNEIVEVVTFNGNKRIEKEVEKWQLLTTHTGRRSFATNYVLRGGKIEQLSYLLGHAEIRTTQRYVSHSPVAVAIMAKEFMQKAA